MNGNWRREDVEDEINRYIRIFYEVFLSSKVNAPAVISLSPLSLTDRRD